MSKSEGNIFQLSEAIDRFGPEAVVAYLVSGHYRQPLAFGEEQLERGGGKGGPAEKLPALEPARARSAAQVPAKPGYPAGGEAAAAVGRFRDALADDFNTPRAMSELFDLVRAANHEEVPGAGAAALEMLGLVGLESLAESADGPDDAGAGLAGRSRAGPRRPGLRDRRPDSR